MNSILVAALLTTIPILVTGPILAAQGDVKTPPKLGGKQDKKKIEKADKVPNPKVLMKTSMGDITLELFADEAPKTVANFIGLAEGTKEFTDKAGEKTKGNYFDGLNFHRVIPNFMAQGGCPLGTGTGDPGYKFADEINAKALGLDKMMVMVDNKPNQAAMRALLVRDQASFQQEVIGPLLRSLGIKSQADLDAKKEEVEKKLGELTVMEVYVGKGYKYDDSRGSHRMLRGTIAMANSGPNTNGSQFFINMVDNEYLNGKHTVFGKVLSGMDVVDKMQKVKMKAQSKPEKDIKIISVRRISPN